MRVDVEKQGTVTVMVPRDALTEGTIPETRIAFVDHGGTAVRMVIDMSHVTFLDSAGIEFLLERCGNLTLGPLRPRLAALTDTVRESLALTKSIRRFSIYDTVEAAVRSYL